VDISRSVDFLLMNAGPVIRWRLHREILHDLTPEQEHVLLDEVMGTPRMQQLQQYRKPAGYIGRGMHSSGLGLESLLEDGESAARLMSNYAIPLEMSLIRDFASALTDDSQLAEAFSGTPAERLRFAERSRGMANGAGLLVLVYTMLALLGTENAEVAAFAETSFAAFDRMRSADSLADLTHTASPAKGRYAYPYVLEDEPFACQYHLETLAHTRSWRTPERVGALAQAVDRINEIMKPDDSIHVWIGSRRIVPYWAYCRTIKPFERNDAPHTALRKTITCLAMATGDRTQVVQRSVANVLSGLQEDGVLRIPFTSAYRKKQFREGLGIPTAYSEIGLETSHRTDTSLWCELTFWAVQLLHLVGQAEGV